MRRIFAWVFAVLGVCAAIYDLLVWFGASDAFRFHAIAEIWADVHRTSLIGLNSFTEKNLSTDLWDAILLPALGFPAVVTFAVLAIALWLLALMKRSQKKRGLMFSRK
ncbi:MAG: hypothetical protein ACPGGK_05135 [Pikeienuella sp.]